MPIKTFLKKQYLTFSCKVRIHKIKKVRALVHPWAGRCSLKKKVFSLTEALIRPVLVYSLLLCMCAPCACVRAVQLSAQSKKSQRSKVTEIKFFNNGDEKTFRAQNYCFLLTLIWPLLTVWRELCVSEFRTMANWQELFSAERTCKLVINSSWLIHKLIELSL